MARALIETSDLNVQLSPSPIEPSWIIEGNPRATSCVITSSSDGVGTTIVWHCTEGKFNWYYEFDELIHILEGSIVIESEGMPPRRYGRGDVIYFRNGAHAKWHVEGHVRKLAFCLKTQPAWIGFGIRVLNKLKRMLVPGQKPAGGLVAAG